MKTLFVLVAVFVSISVILGEDPWTDYTSTVTETTTPPSTHDARCNVTCSLPGMVCGDCGTLCECIYQNDELVARYQDTCTAPTTCGSGVCSTDHTHDCAPGNITFLCAAEGVFPDPLSCKTYHYCIETEDGTIEDFPRRCEDGWAYNYQTTYCAKALTDDDQCYDVPIPYCLEMGQTAAMEENPTMYYICSQNEETGNELYPYLYVCPYGKSYNGNYTCEE